MKPVWQRKILILRGNQKKYEIAKQNRKDAADAEGKRKEGLVMDELGLNAFRRSQ